MKKTVKRKTATLMVLLLIILSGCADKSSRSVQSIPEDAFFVAVVDLGTIMKAYDFNALKNTEMYKQAEREVRRESTEMWQSIESILRDPASSGIGLRDRMFVFGIMDEDMNNQPTIGVLMNVNARRFENTLESLSSGLGFNAMEMFSEREGVKYLQDSETNIIAYNNNSILMLNNDSYTWRFGYSGPDLQRMAIDILNQKNKSINNNPDFRKFLNNCKDINFWAHAGAFKNDPEIRSDMREMVRILGFNPLDSYGHFHIEMKKNGISFSGTMSNEDLSNFNMAKLLENIDELEYLFY